MKNESAITNKEIVVNADESSKEIQELYEEYKKGSETYIKMKDQYKSLKSVLQTEEYHIKQKRDTIADLQCELHKLKVK